LIAVPLLPVQVDIVLLKRTGFRIANGFDLIGYRNYLLEKRNYLIGYRNYPIEKRNYLMGYRIWFMTWKRAGVLGDRDIEAEIRLRTTL